MKNTNSIMVELYFDSLNVHRLVRRVQWLDWLLDEMNYYAYLLDCSRPELVRLAVNLASGPDSSDSDSSAHAFFEVEASLVDSFISKAYASWEVTCARVLTRDGWTHMIDP